MSILDSAIQLGVVHTKSFTLLAEVHCLSLASCQKSRRDHKTIPWCIILAHVLSRHDPKETFSNHGR